MLEIIDEKNISLFLHELRSPMSTLLAIVNNTQKDLESKEKTFEALDKIRSIAAYILSLSDTFLEVTKSMNKFIDAEERHFKSKDIMDYVIDLARFQFSLKNIEFSTNVMDSDVLFIGKHIKITQILINLLSNAYKYTPKGGVASLDCKYKYLSDDYMEVSFIIKDNGIGMSKECLEKVFTVYNRESVETKPNGTGLGLYIVKLNVDELGGSIKVDSIKGVGTSFEVKLPLKISKSKYDLSSSNVLIIDDCSITQQVLLNFLQTVGANCHAELDGDLGMQKFFESPNHYYQVIIVDNILKGVVGSDIVYKIRNSNRQDANSVVIIASSGSCTKFDLDKLKEAGINEFLLKPFTRENLLETIQRHKKTDLIS